MNSIKLLLKTYLVVESVVDSSTPFSQNLPPKYPTYES